MEEKLQERPSSDIDEKRDWTAESSMETHIQNYVAPENVDVSLAKDKTIAKASNDIDQNQGLGMFGAQEDQPNTCRETFSDENFAHLNEDECYQIERDTFDLGNAGAKENGFKHHLEENLKCVQYPDINAIKNLTGLSMNLDENFGEEENEISPIHPSAPKDIGFQNHIDDHNSAPETNNLNGSLEVNNGDQESPVIDAVAINVKDDKNILIDGISFHPVIAEPEIKPNLFEPLNIHNNYPMDQESNMDLTADEKGFGNESQSASGDISMEVSPTGHTPTHEAVIEKVYELAGLEQGHSPVTIGIPDTEHATNNLTNIAGYFNNELVINSVVDTKQETEKKVPDMLENINNNKGYDWLMGNIPSLVVSGDVKASSPQSHENNQTGIHGGAEDNKITEPELPNKEICNDEDIICKIVSQDTSLFQEEEPVLKSDKIQDQHIATEENRDQGFSGEPQEPQIEVEQARPKTTEIEQQIEDLSPSPLPPEEDLHPEPKAANISTDEFIAKELDEAKCELASPETDLTLEKITAEISSDENIRKLQEEAMLEASQFSEIANTQELVQEEEAFIKQNLSEESYPDLVKAAVESPSSIEPFTETPVEAHEISIPSDMKAEEIETPDVVIPVESKEPVDLGIELEEMEFKKFEQLVACGISAINSGLIDHVEQKVEGKHQEPTTPSPSPSKPEEPIVPVFDALESPVEDLVEATGIDHDASNLSKSLHTAEPEMVPDVSDLDLAKKEIASMLNFDQTMTHGEIEPPVIEPRVDIKLEDKLDETDEYKNVSPAEDNFEINNLDSNAAEISLNVEEAEPVVNVPEAESHMLEQLASVPSDEKIPSVPVSPAIDTIEEKQTVVLGTPLEQTIIDNRISEDLTDQKQNVVEEKHVEFSPLETTCYDNKEIQKEEDLKPMYIPESSLSKEQEGLEAVKEHVDNVPHVEVPPVAVKEGDLSISISDKVVKDKAKDSNQKEKPLDKLKPAAKPKATPEPAKPSAPHHDKVSPATQKPTKVLSPRPAAGAGMHQKPSSATPASGTKAPLHAPKPSAAPASSKVEKSVAAKVSQNLSRRTQSHSPSRDIVDMNTRLSRLAEPKKLSTGAADSAADKKKQHDEYWRKKKSTEEKQAIDKEQRRKDAEAAFQNWLQRKELERRRARSTGRPSAVTEKKPDQKRSTPTSGSQSHHQFTPRAGKREDFV